MRRRLLYPGMIAVGLTILTFVLSTTPQEAPPKLVRPVERTLTTEETASLLGDREAKPKVDSWHPPHVVKVWMARHKGRVFRIIQLPRCEHLETVITYNPSGETLRQAKVRVGGVAAVTGSYHHPRSLALADFLQRDGCVLAGARTGRSLLVINRDGTLDISNEYAQIKGQPGISALALGQRLVPLQQDGFSKAFMNRVTDRMAIGVNRHFIFIVQGKSDIWRLAHFIKTKLPVRTAVNSDGGHVVRGRAPVHIVFRWRQLKSPGAAMSANASTFTNK
ncbi:MAG: hypothetical protein QHI38_10465 [Armatimonadota bacterium]|nr:hypothetical protein [Armatimonadota bacterium]